MRFLLSVFIFSSLWTSGAFADEISNGFKSESEAGAVLISGNSETETYSVKSKNSYVWEKDTYTILGRYLRARASGTESARNWEAGFRYERSLVEDFSAYLGHKIESDPFAGYVQRDSSDIGGKYYFVKSDDYNIFVELGYRFQKNMPTAGDVTYDSLGRAFAEINRTIDKTTTLRYWAEYLPNFSRPDAYLANTEASLGVMLYRNFSLKLAYLVQYQNLRPVITTVTPPRDGERIDTTYTTSIVAKF